MLYTNYSRPQPLINQLVPKSIVLDFCYSSEITCKEYLHWRESVLHFLLQRDG